VVAVRLLDDDTVVVDTVDAALFRRVIARTAVDVGVRLLEVTPLDDDLESVFRYLVAS
jgi:ABC-2 type transport system ATP-binding protein